MGSIRRILLVANKWFEADALMAVLTNSLARNPALGTPSQLGWPRTPQVGLEDIVRRPRATVALQQCVTEVWCIQDLMSPFIDYSNTAEKQRALFDILAYGAPPAGLIAFGTAACSEDERRKREGGGRAECVHPRSEYRPPNPSSTWSWRDHMDRVVPGLLEKEFFEALARYGVRNGDRGADAQRRSEAGRRARLTDFRNSGRRRLDQYRTTLGLRGD
jgi:hypothetical protein